MAERRWKDIVWMQYRNQGIYDAVAVNKAAVVTSKKNHNMDRCTCVLMLFAAAQWSLCWKERMSSRG